MNVSVVDGSASHVSGLGNVNISGMTFDFCFTCS